MRRLHVTRAAIAAIGVLCVLLAALCIAGPLPTLHAAIVINGDVAPVDPDDWKSSTFGYVGMTGHGDVTVDSDSDLISRRGYIGCYLGSTGEVTVDGGGSTWTNSHDLYVGREGSGTLNITNGGAVSSSYSCSYIGYYSSSTGEVTVDGGGSTLTNNSYLYVGRYGDGTLNITNGGTVNNGTGYIGFLSSSTSVVTVDGTGSTWNNSYGLVVGYEGSGILNITNGGSVTVADTTRVAYDSGSTGTIDFCAGGGTLTTQSLRAAPTNLTGTGTINTRGLISDVDLVFDLPHGSSHAFILDDQPDQNITVNLDLSDPYNVGDLGIGYRGNGSLSIRDGVTVNSLEGYIGYNTGSTGAVTVDGTDSTWNSISRFYVGHYGDGTLNITDGGAVSNSSGYIGRYSGSTGVVTVDGTGSTWTNSASLYVGYEGSGTLNITGGGSVTAVSISIRNSRSLLAIDVGNSSLFTLVGSGGEIANYGTVRIMAGAGPTAGDAYTPISADTWSGGGTYQAIGGTWNETEHEFAVSGVQSGTSGTMATIDLADTQRLLIADDGTGWSVGASFLATADSSELNFTATAITDETLTDLEALLEPGQGVEGAWDFIVAGDGYTSGDPVYLSFDVGAGYSRSDLHPWHYNETTWSEFDAMDLTYDGQYASFTVRGFSGYAVTAVPEPGTLVSFLIGAATLALFARRRSRQRSLVQ